jgi:hypothetical protein
MAFDIRQTDLGKLNSMTKYPSILTHHSLGDKGVMQDAVQIPFEGRIIGTEKVDGMNTRIIYCSDRRVAEVDGGRSSCRRPVDRPVGLMPRGSATSDRRRIGSGNRRTGA